MDGLDLKFYKGKKVFIQTRNQRNYSGIVVKVDDNSQVLRWIIIIDKKGKRVSLTEGEILLIQEEE